MIAAIKAGMDKPRDALARLEQDNIRYVLLCDGDPLVERIASEYPAGFFAALSKNDVPGYLEEVPSPPGLKIYEVIQR
jgi:hypothetical protein